MSLRVCIHPTESTRSLENQAWADTEEADAWPRACHWEQSPRMPLLALTLLDARHHTAGFCCPWSFSAGHWTLHSTQWPRLIISNWTFAIVSPLKDHASPWRGNICSPFGFIDSAFSPCRGKGGGGWCRQKHSFKWKVPILFLKRLTFVQTVKKWKQKQSNLHSFQFSECGFH